MTTPIRMDDALIQDAALYGKAESRTASLQIAYWARIGKAALENPDLPVDFVRDLLIAQNTKSQSKPFEFRES